MGRHGKPVPTARSPPATGSHHSRTPTPQVPAPGVPTRLCPTTPRKPLPEMCLQALDLCSGPSAPQVHPLLEVNVPNVHRMGQVVLATPAPC